MLRLALILLAAVSFACQEGPFACQQGPMQELTLTSKSLAGKESQITATVRPGFTAKVLPMAKFGSSLQSLKVESSDQRVQLLITLLPPNDVLPRDAAGLEATLRQNCADFVDDSVEGKITTSPLKLANGIGVAAIFTDKSEVGKPTPKGPGHYKLMTSAMIRVGDSTLATVSVFSDSKETPEYRTALEVIEGLRTGK